MIQKAVVTGGTGFIGSRLALELLKTGGKVTLIVRDKRKVIPEIADHPNSEVIQKDISLLSKEDFSEREHDVFFHLGWEGVSPERKNEMNVQLGNIEMSLHALDVSAEIGCRCFLATGTVAEYAFCDDLMNVNARQTPNDMYGAAKVATHYLMEVRSRQLQMPFIWAVIPSTFGEGRRDNNILTYTINELLSGRRPKYGNLMQMWDFLYVGEVVRAITLIAEKGRRDIVYGIGSGEYHPLREYIECVRDIIDPNLDLGIGEIPAMSEKAFSSCVNIYALVRDTGFKPEVSFEDGIKKMIEWKRRETGSK